MSGKSNTEEFIRKAKLKHGDKYDYSKVEYVKAIEKVIIICMEHGAFLQTPNIHLSKHGCKKCSTFKTSNLQRTKIQDFIEKSKVIHCDKYDYSKVEYINWDTKIIIICREHGEFIQSPGSHLSKKGCKKCSTLKNSNLHKKSNAQDFVEKSKVIHGDKYDYSKVEYIRAMEKVVIICKEHGEFIQSPNAHLVNKGCNLCGIINMKLKQRSNSQEFIENAKEIHSDKYDYSKVEYIRAFDKVTIICKKHGEFKLTPNNHLSKKGCPFCVNKTEGKLYEKIKQKYHSIIPQFSPDWIGKKRFDFCIPEHNIIIELDGRQHFEDVKHFKTSFEEQHINDKEKEELATEHNYCVIRLLQEDVFYDTYDWFGELLENIQILINEKPIIQNIYMDKNDEYERFL